MWRGPQHAARVFHWLVAYVVCNPPEPLATNTTSKINGTAEFGVKAQVPNVAIGVASTPQGDCWQGGYTAEVCCKANPVVNCWDTVFTFGRCCTGQVPTASATVMTITSLSPVPVVTTTVTAVTSMSTVATDTRSPSSGDPSCWQDGFTYKRCCEVPPIVAAISGCWDPVFTERRCCGTRIPPASATPVTTEARRRPHAMDAAGTPAHPHEASSSVSAPVAAILSALSSPKAWGETLADASPERQEPSQAVEALHEAAPENWVAVAGKDSIASEKDVIDIDLVAALGSTQVIAENVEKEVTGLSSSSHSEIEELGDEYDDGSQAAFFRREGSRRFVAYFQKAHRLLNKVLSADETAADGCADVLRSDAVQIYHLLYETVNQLVGGMQLAFEATSQHDERLDSEAQSQGSSAAMRATFLSAAMVLARLAQASKGTPLEHEDFGAQATAAIALSCPSRDNPEAFRKEMSRRISWLENGSENDSGKASENSAIEMSPWRAELLSNLRQRINSSLDADQFGAMFERSWQMYAEDLVEAVWRPANGRLNAEGSNAARSTLNPTDESLSSQGKAGHMWQIFPSFLMTKSLRGVFSRGSGVSDETGTVADDSEAQASCSACEELTRIVLDKYAEFEQAMRDHRGGDFNDHPRQDEINNAFFAWQLTHESEQEDVVGQEQWPELYYESRDFQELRYHLKLACLEYLQQVYDPQLNEMDLAQLDLTLWASVTPANAGRSTTSMDMPFHDHPLALLSGVFYAQAGGVNVASRTPTVFADPRGTTAFRYTRQASRRKTTRDDETIRDTPEPTAPFHRLAYSHASDGKLVVFPSWLVHGVPPHRGEKPRVVFAFNLHTLQGTTLSSWAKTAL